MIVYNKNQLYFVYKMFALVSIPVWINVLSSDFSFLN